MKQRWLERNYLFHLILIYVVLNHSEIDWKNYKLGNFGSTNPSSDIDACIQYDGSETNKISDVIKHIEDAYINLVGLPCLKLDIEFYDSYISKTIGNNQQTYLVDFKTTDMNAQLQQLLPYALASMMRNMRIAAVHDDNARSREKHTKSDGTTYDNNAHRHGHTEQQISDVTKKLYTTITYNENELIDAILGQGSNMLRMNGGNPVIIPKLAIPSQSPQSPQSPQFTRPPDIYIPETDVNILDNTIPEYCKKIMICIFSNEKMVKLPIIIQLLHLINNTVSNEVGEKTDDDSKYVFETATELYKDYFITTKDSKPHTRTYDERRNKYYTQLQSVESKLKPNNDVNQITDIDFLKALCESQLYRQEGYICISTVLHIPRYAQACKGKGEDMEGCMTTCNDETKALNPACLMNDCTYLLSMIEQLGFIFRFYIEAKGDINDKHFQEKLQKYKPRWDDALKRIQPVATTPTSGGRKMRKNRIITKRIRFRKNHIITNKRIRVRKNRLTKRQRTR
jgi:hypothetical protein